jgi:hypothetical protein
LRQRAAGRTAPQSAAATPLANVMLSLLHALGLEDFSKFGDSTAPFDLTGGAAPARVIVRRSGVVSLALPTAR